MHDLALISTLFHSLQLLEASQFCMQVGLTRDVTDKSHVPMWPNVVGYRMFLEWKEQRSERQSIAMRHKHLLISQRHARIWNWTQFLYKCEKFTAGYFSADAILLNKWDRVMSLNYSQNILNSWRTHAWMYSPLIIQYRDRKWAALFLQSWKEVVFLNGIVSFKLFILYYVWLL